MSSERAAGVPAADEICDRFLTDARDQDPDSGSVYDILELAESVASLPPGTGA
jgi:hypothetical protein